MSVVSIASAKGGCGKSTLALLIGAEFALDDYRVALLDCDLNQHASAFGLKAKLPNLTIIPDIGEAEVLKTLRVAEKDHDLVLIDLPGGSSTLAFKALQRSHFVLVPTQPSLPDARDAMKTVAQIDDAGSWRVCRSRERWYGLGFFQALRAGCLGTSGRAWKGRRYPS
jgi:chromosome partitioning protein